MSKTYKGIDISAWQRGLTDGSVLTNGGVKYVIAKLTESYGYTDDCFTPHYNMCKAAKIPVGAYVYSHSTTAEGGRKEAEYALKVLAGRKLDLPIFLDIEGDILQYGKAALMASALAFGEVIKAAGYKWGTYASASPFRTSLDAATIRAAGGVIWCAAYNDTGAGMDCDIWQHSSSGRLNGYGHNLDANIMYNTALIDGEAAQPIKVTAQAVIDVALGEVGYLEKMSNAQLDDKTANAGVNNWNKYARDLDALGNFYNFSKNGFAWCDIFVDWCFVKAFGPEKGRELVCQPLKSSGAGCIQSVRFYESQGRFYVKSKGAPKPGDQIFFGDYSDCAHTGLVYAVDATTVYTVEGNTSGGSGVDANGGGVFKKSYPLNYYYIFGYGRPAYDDSTVVIPGADAPTEEPEKTEEGTCMITVPVIEYGMTGNAVKSMQRLLIGRGYSCGWWGADGEYGDGTAKALKRFQTAAGLTADGICGKDTWTALIAG